MRHLLRRSIVLCLGLGIFFTVPLYLAFAGVIPLGPNVEITDTGLNETSATIPDLAVVGNTVYAAWHDERDDNAQDVNGAIYFAKSTDGGATWSANIRVTNPAVDAWADDPAIAVQPDGTIWIVWHQLYEQDSNEVNDLRLARSTDGGQTWEVATWINGVDGNEDLWRPDLAADENYIYLLHRYYACEPPCNASSREGFTIALKRTETATLNSITRVVSDDPYGGRFTTYSGLDDGPAISLTLRNGVLCAAWEDQRSRFAIYGTCSTDNGLTFAPSVPVSGDDGVLPVIALGPDGTLYAVYSVSTDASNNMIFRRSTTNAASWDAPIPITDSDDDDILNWDVTVDANGQIVLAWVQEEGFDISNLYLSSSVDGGQNFATTPVEDLQGEYPTVSEQFAPSVVTTGTGADTRAILAWGDNRNIHSEIWSARFLLDGVPPTSPGNLQATGQDTSILLQWNPANDTNGIQGYRVYRATAPGGPFAEISALLVEGTAYRDVGLTGGTPYSYHVAAVDGTGNTGPLSAVATATAQQGTAIPLTGTLAFEPATTQDQVRLRAFPGGVEQTINGGDQPRFSNDGARLYYRTPDAISVRPVAGGPAEIFAPSGDIFEFDIAGNEGHYATLNFRQFASGIPGGLCNVSEPYVYNAAGQMIYSSEYDLDTGVALSSDQRWLAYRYLGFCTAASQGTFFPPNFCIVEVATGEQSCIEGADYEDADFAPTGNEIVFAAPLTGQYEIWKAQVQADGALANYTQLTRGAANQPAGAPQWSSSGSSIVFQRDVDPGTGEDWRLYTVQADGTMLRSLDIAGTEPAFAGGGASVPTDLPYNLYLPGVQRD